MFREVARALEIGLSKQMGDAVTADRIAAYARPRNICMLACLDRLRMFVVAFVCLDLAAAHSRDYETAAVKTVPGGGRNCDGRLMGGKGKKGGEEL